jgi:hypothetical protein
LLWTLDHLQAQGRTYKVAGATPAQLSKFFASYRPTDFLTGEYEFSQNGQISSTPPPVSDTLRVSICREGRCEAVTGELL